VRGTETDTRPYTIGNSQGLIVRDSVTEQQEAAVQSLLDTRKQPGVSGLR